MTVNSIFADRLYYYMAQKGYTQSYLAELLGVNRSTVSDWVNGISKPRKSRLVLLAQVLGITKAELLGDEETNNEVHDYYTLECVKLLQGLNIAGKKRIMEIIEDYRDNIFYATQNDDK